MKVEFSWELSPAVLTSLNFWFSRSLPLSLLVVCFLEDDDVLGEVEVHFVVVDTEEVEAL